MSIPGPPPGLDLSESKVSSIVSAFVITWVLSVSIVGLRVVARRLVKSNLWWDDWLIIASLVSSAVFLFNVTCYMIPKGGFGKHLWAGPPNALEIYFLGLFIAEYAFTTSIIVIKWSILAFYWRIFGTRRTTKLVIIALFAIVTLWGVAVILVSTFSCWPISAFWRRFDDKHPLSPSEYKCTVDTSKFFLANAIPNIITDILMLLIPIPSIWSLQLRKGQKISLLGIFLVGVFVTGVAFVRLHYLLVLDFTNIDATWMFSETMMWTGVEVNVGTICACLPSLKPILNIVLYRSAQTSSEQPSAKTQSANVTKTNTTDMRKRDNNKRLNLPSTGASTAFVTSKNQQPDDSRPFTVLTDNESDTWAEAGSVDLEMNQMNRKPGKGTITKTIGVHIDYAKE